MEHHTGWGAVASDDLIGHELELLNLTRLNNCSLTSIAPASISQARYHVAYMSTDLSFSHHSPRFNQDTYTKGPTILSTTSNTPLKHYGEDFNAVVHGRLRLVIASIHRHKMLVVHLQFHEVPSTLNRVRMSTVKLSHIALCLIETVDSEQLD